MSGMQSELTMGGAGLDPRIVDRLADALDRAARLIDGLNPDAYSLPSPCRGWSVIDVINHLAAVTEKFGRFAAGLPGPIRQRQGDLVGSAPAACFRAVVEVAMTAWHVHPEAIE